MKIVYAFYAAHRYWPDEGALKAACAETARRFCDGAAYSLYWDDRSAPPRAEGDCVVLIPFSGAVQNMMLADARAFKHAIICGAYIRGNLPSDIADGMMRANTAPALMDTWAVLRRTHENAFIALNAAELKQQLRLLDAVEYIRRARILKIGATEPWVVSNAADDSIYEARFGARIIPVDQREVASRYEAATRADARSFYDWFSSNSIKRIEPDDMDMWNASRMACALAGLMEDYDAEGAAIACFDLLRTGTNMCLGVSYINDCTDRFISCECDMDSAVTMLFMKKLTKHKLWMANPGLQPDKTINFSHCTAPVCIMGEPLPTVLRSHHESGIGVSPQVEVPAGIPVTACRISDDCSKITIHNGVTVSGDYENACRTQVHVRLDDFDHYIKTVLGCHQVLAFEDIAAQLRELAGVFRFDIL